MKLALTCFSALAMLVVMLGCQSGPKPTSFAPYFDGVFEVTSAENVRNISGELLELSHGMVSDVNERFVMNDPVMYYGAKLDEDGNVANGAAMVLQLNFVDRGEQSVVESFDTAVTMRLEIDAKNQVTKGILRGKANGALALLTSGTTGGLMRKGKVYLMYRDEDVAIGQLQVEFDAFHINASFRALGHRR